MQMIKQEASTERDICLQDNMRKTIGSRRPIYQLAFQSLNGSFCEMTVAGTGGNSVAHYTNFVIYLLEMIEF